MVLTLTINKIETKCMRVYSSKRMRGEGEQSIKSSLFFPSNKKVAFARRVLTAAIISWKLHLCNLTYTTPPFGTLI